MNARHAAGEIEQRRIGGEQHELFGLGGGQHEPVEWVTKRRRKAFGRQHVLVVDEEDGVLEPPRPRPQA